MSVGMPCGKKHNAHPNIANPMSLFLFRVTAPVDRRCISYEVHAIAYF